MILSDFTFTLYLPVSETKDLDLRVFYRIYEYENLLDSSNMTEREWIQIAEDIMVCDLFNKY